jgi:hypothetical protein
MYLYLSPCDLSPSRPVEIKRSAPPPRPSGGGGSGSGSGKSVFVSNLPTDASIVSCDLLRDAFGHCGTIANVVSSHPPAANTPRSKHPPQRNALIYLCRPHALTLRQRLLARDDGSLRGLAQVRRPRVNETGANVIM